MQRGSCALPSCEIALLLARRLLWTAVASPPLGSEQGILLFARTPFGVPPKRELKSLLKCEISEKAGDRKQTSFLVYCEQMADDLCANSLHARAVVSGRLDALTAADNSNPLFLIVISAILGAVRASQCVWVCSA